MGRRKTSAPTAVQSEAIQQQEQWLSVPCSACGAAAGVACDGGGTHGARLIDAQGKIEGAAVAAKPTPPRARIELHHIARTRIHPWPGNPRRTFDPEKIEQLAASFAARIKAGKPPMLQPIKLRPHPAIADEFLIVYGERRWRAAEKASVDELPSFVEDMDDEQALDEALVENAQREDVHPIEEADGYSEWIRHGRTPEWIAGRVGKPLRHVQQRLRLTTLCPAAREALSRGAINLGTALALAALANPERQAEATTAIAGSASTSWGPMTTARATELIRSRFMLLLDTAPFDRSDATLLRTAPACTACPKHTAAQRDLFDDADDDRCTDPACWDEKKQASWERAQERARRAGVAVLDDAKTSEVLPVWSSGTSRRCSFVGLDEIAMRQEREDPNAPGAGEVIERTYREVLGDKARPAAIARHPRTGEIVELIERDAAAAALRAAGVAPDENDEEAPRSATPEQQAAAARRDKEEEIKRALWPRWRAAAIEAAEATARPDASFWKGLIFAATAWEDEPLVDALERRGKDAEEIEAHRERLEDLIEFATDGQQLDKVRGLFVEIMTDRGSWGNEGRWMFERLGVDTDEIEAELRRELDPEGLAAPRCCRICRCTDTDGCPHRAPHPAGCRWIAEDLCSACDEHKDEQRDDTIRRLFRAQGLSFAHIAKRFDLAAAAVEALCVPEPTTKARTKPGLDIECPQQMLFGARRKPREG